MGYIKQLSEELIKQIAAGEVIERPASVVKELVENSIDAGSKKIEIEIQRAGKYIKVSDDGSGINSNDIELLFKTHATSKINSLDDLWDIGSLGFRGEALASISSVSKVICSSKHFDEDCGFEINVINGKITKKSSAISKGTVFEINDLFYNVPAREKFLKAESTEVDHIYDYVLSLAISHPEISFTLINNKNILLKSNASNDLKETIYELLGDDLRNNLIELSAKNHFLSLSGYVSALELYKSNRKSIFVFINGRSVKCPLIMKAINSSFEGLLPPGKYPAVVLNLTFKPKFVDVNVHPTKKEVRYTHPNDVYSLILRAIQDSVSSHYKNVYKEKSAYGLQDYGTMGQSEIQKLPAQSYTNAAFEFYKDEPTSPRANEPMKDDETGNRNSQPLVSNSQLFSVSNFKCYKIHSDKPIANITKVGNKSIFEVGSIFENNLQIVFSGEIVGDQNYQKQFFNSLADMAGSIYKQLPGEDAIQKKLINTEYDENDVGLKPIQRKKPPESTLYKVWERDNWTCVYCEKQLLDPKVVKKAIPEAENAFVTYMNESGKEVTNHILMEHSASYDHYLPVSKLPQFNFDEENLFACCISCNREKLDSMSIKAWKPEVKNSWNKSLEIAGLVFNSSKDFLKSSVPQDIK